MKRRRNMTPLSTGTLSAAQIQLLGLTPRLSALSQRLRGLRGAGREGLTGLGDSCCVDFLFYLSIEKRAENVQILAVAHASRRPGYWRARM
jgi:hypothetical protein